MLKFNRLIKSLKYAGQGLQKVFKEEQNFQIHVIIAVLVIAASLFFQIKIWEFIILLLLIAFVMILEIINSVFERFIDILKPRIHDYVKDIKDMGAAIVFIGSITAAIIGLMIFLPYFWQLIK